eukprot:COSAG01_NODE_10038_length_2267_cov_2.529982_2_plen_162_part_00
MGSLGRGWNMAHPHGLEPKLWPHAGIPTAVQQWFARSARTSTVADGAVGASPARVPKPTPLLLGPGDAAIGNFCLPHASVRVAPLAHVVTCGVFGSSCRYCGIVCCGCHSRPTSEDRRGSKSYSDSSLTGKADPSRELSKSAMHSPCCRCPTKKLSDGAPR